MFNTIKEFTAAWEYESGATQKVFNELTDASLAQAVVPGHRTLGRLAWHLTTSIVEIMEKTGLKLSGPGHDAPTPGSAEAICEGYRRLAGSLMEEINRSWTDATLSVQDDMYGEMWTRGVTLRVLLDHQIHHRGQMTVLMRQAGLRVPGVYGPSQDEWGGMGMEPPAV